MIRFEDMLEKVRAYSPDADVELLRRAYVFSAFEHRGQVRHSGEPYLIHPLAVADVLADMKLDAVAVAAGLLHDVVEDTLTTIERIQELFGPEVAHVVEGVTKISAIPFLSTEERQAENFRKMLLAMVDDIRVILVKLADRLHNMRTLNHLPEERRAVIASAAAVLVSSCMRIAPPLPPLIDMFSFLVIQAAAGRPAPGPRVFKPGKMTVPEAGPV